MGTAAATGWAEWLLVAGGWSLLTAGGLLLLWALLWDRSRGRKRCPKCWYDMGGAVAREVEDDGRDVFVCPECGRRVKGEKGLRRTRRRWGWVAVAMLMVVTGANCWFVRPRLAREGWWAVLPSSVIVWVCPIAEPGLQPQLPGALRMFKPPSGSLVQRLVERGKKERLWWWQDVVLMRRVFARYPDETIPLTWVPKHWATDVPLRMQVRTWMNYGPKDSVAGVRAEGSAIGWTDTHDPGSPVPAVDSRPLTTGQIRFQTRIRSCGITIWSGRREVSIDLVGPLAEAMSPVTDAKATEALKRQRPRLFRLGGKTWLMVDESMRLTFTSAVRCEVRRDGVTVGWVDYYQQNPERWADHDRVHEAPVMFGEIVWLAGEPVEIDLDRAVWTLRFTSLPEVAMLDYKSAEEIAKMERTDGQMNRYWVGEFEVPLEIDEP